MVQRLIGFRAETRRVNLAVHTSQLTDPQALLFGAGGVRDRTLVLIGVHRERRAKLPDGRKAACGLGGAARFIEGRQKHRDQQRDDSNNH